MSDLIPRLASNFRETVRQIKVNENNIFRVEMNILNLSFHVP